MRSLSALRTLAGATSIVVPFAIVVHLLAEGLALGAGAFAPAFWLRHVYLLAPLVLAAWSFGRTVGIGRPHAELIRRCALIRARLSAAGAGSTILALGLANLAFFGVTQLLEGDPIASASIVTGLAVAVAGALLSALVIFFWGRSIVARTLGATARVRNGGMRTALRRRFIDPPRAAARAYSLFVPNRPPPIVA